MSYKIKVSKSKLEPIKSMFRKDDLFCYETNVRTVTTFSYPKPQAGSKEEYEINFARNQIFKNQYKLPMKYLMPEEGVYLAQKSPLMDKSMDIRNAARIIEPINIGFNEYIKYIPINQDIPLGTTYTIRCKVPYNSQTRYFFMSNQLKCTDDIKSILKKGEYDFDPYIHIGTLDIGSEYTARFVVSEVNLNLYDSFTLFTFNVEDDSFSIITYDFMNVDTKKILEEVLKKCDDRAKAFIKECIKAL